MRIGVNVHWYNASFFPVGAPKNIKVETPFEDLIISTVQIV
jgi:hypothetical protein